MSMKASDEHKCAECKVFIGEHSAVEAKICLRKISKKVYDGLVAIPYPFDKVYHD